MGRQAREAKTVYECGQCGERQAKWFGKCPACGEFDTCEEKVESRAPEAPSPGKRATDLAEKIEVGKSTLLLQLCANLATGCGVHYISGEESLDQIQLRAGRVGISDAPVGLIATTDGLAISDYIETLTRGSVVVVDSVQAMDCNLDSLPGSTSQVKALAATLIPAAKRAGVSLVLVVQVNKDGNFAGPNILAHAVDVTLHLESDLSSGLFRILRCEKNRFGATDEVGIFEMAESGLDEVANPSEVFIAQRDTSAFGTTIFPSLEGTRPLMLEIQALVAPTMFGNGRRSAIGWDNNRLHMILATLGTRLGLGFGELDVYINVAGGLKVNDPAMDLAVATALISSRAQIPLEPHVAVFGEIGLGGEIRSVSQDEARIREARSLGYGKILKPAGRSRERGRARTSGDHDIHEMRRLVDVFDALEGFQGVLQAG